MKFWNHCVRWFFVPAVALLLCGCPYESQVPLSARDDAELDDALIGTWRVDATEEKPSWTVIIHRFNKREFLVVSEHGDEETDLLRTFATRIDNEKFLNIQDVTVSDRKKVWMFVNYAVTKDELRVRLVEEGPFKEQIGCSEDLNKFLREHLGSKDLYEEDETIVFKRVPESTEGS